jgi:hypothetical protein
MLQRRMPRIPYRSGEYQQRRDHGDVGAAGLGGDYSSDCVAVIAAYSLCIRLEDDSVRIRFRAVSGLRAQRGSLERAKRLDYLLVAK